VPQQILEATLESRLAERGVQVLWNHRVSGLHASRGGVTAEVQRLARGGGEHALVEERFAIRPQYVLGADGYRSAVRHALETSYDETSAADLFAVFELTADRAAGAEARVVFSGGKAAVLWPLGAGRFRWSFQIDSWEGFEETRFKSRFYPKIGDDPFPYLVRERLRELVAERAPWFSAEIGEVIWSMTVRFESRLAGRFGHGRMWLAGDAAHLVGPIGSQSMNVGLHEAHDLARRLAFILREDYPASLLDRYETGRRHEWHQLLSDPLAGRAANPWVRENAARILPCIPASGGELALLLGQLGLELAGGEEPASPFD
jgi:2-polyprenyl-6-methoxyphenol hydroxylase-like FAD-dependent oxidoreductase